MPESSLKPTFTWSDKREQWYWTCVISGVEDQLVSGWASSRIEAQTAVDEAQRAVDRPMRIREPRSPWGS